MIRSVIGFLEDERGATAVEYALVVALVSVGIVGGIDMLGQGVDGAMTSVSSDLEAVAKQ